MLTEKKRRPYAGEKAVKPSQWLKISCKGSDTLKNKVVLQQSEKMTIFGSLKNEEHFKESKEPFAQFQRFQMEPFNANKPLF